jgi:hypothetical protein
MDKEPVSELHKSIARGMARRFNDEFSQGMRRIFLEETKLTDRPPGAAHMPHDPDQVRRLSEAE